MLRGSSRLAAAAVWMFSVAAVIGGCREPPESIEVHHRDVIVLNQTRQEWHDVEIWLNDHYRVIVRSMPAGQRMRVPFDTFVAGGGQRFDSAKQVPRGVEVTARTADGTDVVLVWGKGRWR